MTTTATETIRQARRIQAEMAAEGHPLSLRNAWTAARVGQIAAAATDEELRRQARWERVKAGMVAGYISDLRAVGAWDGE